MTGRLPNSEEEKLYVKEILLELIYHPTIKPITYISYIIMLTLSLNTIKVTASLLVDAVTAIYIDVLEITLLIIVNIALGFCAFLGVAGIIYNIKDTAEKDSVTAIKEDNFRIVDAKVVEWLGTQYIDNTETEVMIELLDTGEIYPEPFKTCNWIEIKKSGFCYVILIAGDKIKSVLPDYDFESPYCRKLVQKARKRK